MSNRDNEFLNAIELTSGTERGDIDRGISEYLEDRRKKTREKAQALYDERIAKQRELDRAAGGKAEHDRALRERTALAGAKAAAEERVFAAVKKRLTEYAASREYKTMVAGAAKKMLALCGENDIVIYVRGEDSDLIPEITALSDRMTVETADDICIGGIRGVSAGARLILDDTLDTAREEQRAYWREISGLDEI